MERKTEIDIVKGLGILSVVIGHIVPGATSNIIFLFHMPLFFLVSGYLHRVNPDDIGYLKSKAISLLLPYIVYLLIFQLKPIWCFVSAILNDPSLNSTLLLIKHIVRLLWGGRMLTGTVGIFWFVTCLFITQQLYNYLSNRVNVRMKLLLAFMLYISSFLNQYIFEWFPFPFAANVVLCSFLFYTIGNICGNNLFYDLNIAICTSHLFISVATMALVFYGYNLNFNMKYTYYGWFIISPLASISITKVISLIATILVYNVYSKNIFSFCGKASMTIMFTHQFLHLNFDEYCKIYPWIMSFSILVMCLMFHYIVTLNSISRLLLLGSRYDLELLTISYCRTRSHAVQMWRRFL